MRVLFLDVDGVLISYADTKEIIERHRKQREIKKKEGWFLLYLDLYLVGQLKRVINYTDCKIVVSSSWRNGLMDELLKLLEKAGIDRERIIGKTPKVSNGEYGSWREYEILKRLEDSEDNVESWAVVDDEDFDLMSIKDMGKLVKTDPSKGLTIEKSSEIISKLLET